MLKRLWSESEFRWSLVILILCFSVLPAVVVIENIGVVLISFLLPDLITMSKFNGIQFTVMDIYPLAMLGFLQVVVCSVFIVLRYITEETIGKFIREAVVAGLWFMCIALEFLIPISFEWNSKFPLICSKPALVAFTIFLLLQLYTKYTELRACKSNEEGRRNV